MGHVEEHLRRWVAAGILDQTTAESIRTYERDTRTDDGESRPSVLEALLYLGIVVLSVGVFSLFAQNWNDLQSWSRVLAVGVPTALLFGVGLLLRASPESEFRRGGQAAWLVTVALFAGSVAVTINEYGLGLGDPGEPGALLAIAVSTFALAVALWVPSPSYPQVFAIAGATVFLGQAVGNWPDEFSKELAGMTILAVAVAALALAEAEWLTPTLPARALFAALAILGPFQAGVDRGPLGFELLAGAMAAAVIALGVVRGSFLVVLVGVGGAFFVLINFVLTHFSDRIGAPMAFMVSGGILVAGVLLLALYRRNLEQRSVAS